MSLKKLLEAMKENNDFHADRGACWNSWEHIEDAADIYEIELTKEESELGQAILAHLKSGETMVKSFDAVMVAMIKDWGNK